MPRQLPLNSNSTRMPPVMCASWKLQIPLSWAMPDKVLYPLSLEKYAMKIWVPTISGHVCMGAVPVAPRNVKHKNWSACMSVWPTAPGNAIHQQARPDNDASGLCLCVYWPCDIYEETDGQTDGWKVVNGALKTCWLIICFSIGSHRGQKQPRNAVFALA